MATTPKSRSKNSGPATRTRSASNARPRPAAAKRPPAPAPESTVSKLRGPVMAGGLAIAGIVGGVVLGAKGLPRKRRRFQLPSVSTPDLGKLDMKKTTKQVGRASKQFGELTRELRKAGEQAERIGDALS
jgi:hypothetical protein